LYDAQPLVFEDPYAVRILGNAYAEDLRKTPRRTDRVFSIALRAFLVARSRYAEDNLAVAVADGVRQYVLLGAGLDTFGWRNPWTELKVFEVDHPATQQWKHGLIEASGLSAPVSVTYVPVDFECEGLPEKLESAGFDAAAPTFFAWLGVVPYLTLEAFRTTLEFIAERPRGSGVVLDYSQPRSALPYFEQLALDSLSLRVKQAGEPFQLFFTPKEMAAELRAWSMIEDLGSDNLNARYFDMRTDGLRTLGSAGRMLCAWV